jgi:nitrous oxide reductase
MTVNNETSRRQFLTTSAKVAAAAGIIGTGGCATTGGAKLQAVAGRE